MPFSKPHTKKQHRHALGADATEPAQHSDSRALAAKARARAPADNRTDTHDFGVAATSSISPARTASSRSSAPSRSSATGTTTATAAGVGVGAGSALSHLEQTSSSATSSSSNTTASAGAAAAARLGLGLGLVQSGAADLRIFQLAEQLRERRLREAARAVAEEGRWKAAAGSVGDAGAAGLKQRRDLDQDQGLNPDQQVKDDGKEEVSQVEKKMSRRPFRSVAGFFAAKKAKRASSTRSESAVEAEPRKLSPDEIVWSSPTEDVSLVQRDVGSRPASAPPKEVPSPDEKRTRTRRLFRTDTMKRDSLLRAGLSSATIHSDKDSGEDAHHQLESEADDKDAHAKAMSTSKRKRPPFLKFSISDQGGMPTYKQRMMSAAFEPVTPGISEIPNFFSRRRAVRMDEPRPTPVDDMTGGSSPLGLPSPLSGGHSTPSPFPYASSSASAVAGGSQAPASAPAMASRKERSRGYFGEPSSWPSEDLGVMEEEIEYHDRPKRTQQRRHRPQHQSQQSHKSYSRQQHRPGQSVQQQQQQQQQQQEPWMFQIRHDTSADTSYTYGTQFDHSADALAAVRDIPDHLPNSPICPQNWPKHKRGSGACVMHRRAGQQRAGELAL